MEQNTRPGKHTKNYGTSPFYSWVNMGKSTISMAIFSSYVSLPEGTGKNAMMTGKMVSGEAIFSGPIL